MLGCQKSGSQTPGPDEYSETPQSITLTGGSIREASGIADSKANPGYLWVEEDSGNPSQLYLLGHDGKIAGKIRIVGGINRDWEDIVLGAGPVKGTKYLYVGDIGDNNAVYPSYTLYRFIEPKINIADITSSSITTFTKLTFKYPDGSHDAEAFLVDSNTRDIYVITKREDSSRLYKLPFPQDTTKMMTAIYISRLPYNYVTSATLSPDSKELIVKTYTNLYFYTRSPSESIATTLSRTPSILHYQIEQQGEAVCFALDYSGFYTLSETRETTPAPLYFYKRN
ncbi:MAG TPA: hypothetical protein VNS58_28120 [Puia sp.]|nr:hypothetical protein [Puia sp.]